MQKLSRDSLYSLEKYSEIRNDFRKQVMEHKKNRRLQLDDHITLYFEDQLTMQYQVQEMLRIEKIFESEAIEEELSAYNPLIPDGSNWKATMMVEYVDVEERKEALAKLIGIEDKIWIKVNTLDDKIFAIADEDMQRNSEEKTSAVHFLRFELSQDMVKAVKGGVTISAGVDHPACHVQINAIPENIYSSLINDLN
ncbi:MAG: DUF3501 family protein [Gammaproteobacteria bacterium]|nr:DUF3501 family protein [Gammaproteobacteria bacterium]